MNSRKNRKVISLEYIVKRARQGNNQAFIQLIETNRQSMYKVARSYFSNEEDIADAIQDTIETCYRSLPDLKQERYFRTWLIRILIHKCIDIIRKKRRENPTDLLPERGINDPALKNCEFEQLMRSLDEKYRTILLLYYSEGFKISEIAQLLDMEENTVKSRLSRGRKKFRDIWMGETAMKGGMISEKRI